jgi:hypothetical protein
MEADFGFCSAFNDHNFSTHEEEDGSALETETTLRQCIGQSDQLPRILIGLFALAEKLLAHF